MCHLQTRKNKRIEQIDTRSAEEEKYSESKFKDLVNEYQKRHPFIRHLIESFSGSLHINCIKPSC